MLPHSKSIDADASEPFEQYGRLFWKLIAKLARQGYVVPPNDAQDLISDFYVNAWAGLKTRFDPQKGDFKTYAISAFYRFARTRIVRTQAWRSRLREFSTVHVRSPISVPADEAADLAQLRSLIDDLDQAEHLVLIGVLEGRSERELGKQLGISRYAVRQRLIDAIGKTAVALGEIHSASPVDARIVESLWKDGRSVRDTANRLGVTLTNIREARERSVANILAAISSSSLSKENYMNDSKLNLFKHALLTPGDLEALEEVSRYAGEIREHLEEDDIAFTDDELHQLEVQCDWVAQVYAKLGFRGEDDDNKEIAHAMEEISAKEDEQIALAFAEAIENLPDEFHDWADWFESVPDAPDPYQCYLRSQSLVKQAGPHARSLTRFGMTPGTFIQAARGVQLLLKSLHQRASMPQDDENGSEALTGLIEHMRSQLESGEQPSVILTLGQRSGSNDHVPKELFIAHVAGTPGCPPKAAEPLARWMVRVAQYRPFLFPGFQAKSINDEELRLKRDLIDRGDDLVMRWGKHADEATGQKLQPA